MAIQELRKELGQYNASNIRVPVVRKISSRYFRKVRTQPKNEIFKQCEDLLESGNWMERTVVFDWAFRLGRRARYQNTMGTLFVLFGFQIAHSFSG